MRVVSRAEADELLKGWGSPLLNDGFSVLRQTPPTIFLPVDTGRKAALARYLTYEVLGARAAVLEVFDEDVFEHVENTHLFNRWRSGLGESRELHEAPCHVVEEADELDTSALLALAMYFVWSVAVFTENADVMFLISHDEYLAVLCPDESRLREITLDLQVFAEQRHA